MPAPHSPGPRHAAAGSDIAPGLLDRLLPAPARPYARLARLDRPIGTWLLLLPGWWSIVLAAPTSAALRWDLLGLFAVGAVAMRGAGCTVNDILDRDLDARVARTRSRPLPSGEVGLGQALAFLVLQLALGAAVLALLPATAILLGLAILVPIAVYPLMKRVTDWPQLALGLVFNWGALMGWAAATGGLALAPVLLYLGGIAWTLGYDTVYAHQDKADDAVVGVRSSALALGRHTRPFLWAMYALAVALIAAAGWRAGAGLPFALGVAVAALLLAEQAARVDLDDPADCLRRFRAHRFVGWAILAGLVIDRWAMA